jgi:hypothetical protein
MHFLAIARLSRFTLNGIVAMDVFNTFAALPELLAFVNLFAMVNNEKKGLQNVCKTTFTFYKRESEAPLKVFESHASGKMGILIICVLDRII